MKTSDKILIGFFILVFLIPILALTALNSEIKKGHYILVKEDRVKISEHKASVGAYKYIQVKAPLPLLYCDIRYADTPSYEMFSKDDRDSVRVYNLADTLVVQYISVAAVNKDNRMGTHLQLNLPAAAYLSVDNAEVTLLDMAAFTNKDFAVEVKGAGKLKIKMGEAREENAGQLSADTAYAINELSVRTMSSRVSITGVGKIRQVKMQAEGGSAINIENSIRVDTVTGQLSDSTIINAGWQFIKKLPVANH